MHQLLTAITALGVALTGLSLPAASATASRVPVRIVYVSGGGGLDWGDAGIGAAAGAGITLLGLGGALAIAQRHTHSIADPRRPGFDPEPPPRASQTTQERSEAQ